MSSGYGITNLLSGLAASAFAWSSGYATDRDKLNDGKQDEVAAGSSSAQASGQTLTINLGSAQAVAAIALLSHNLASGACTVAVTYADDSGFTVGTGTAKAASTVPTAAPNDKDLVLQFPSVTKQYWRLTFAHSGTKTLRLGEVLFFGSLTTLSRQSIYGDGESSTFPQNRVRTDTGAERATVLSAEIRTKRLNYKDLRGTAERDELMGMWRATLGGARNLLWVETIESAATAATAEGMQCIWSKLGASMGWTQGDFLLFDITGIVLTGLGREAGS